MGYNLDIRVIKRNSEGNTMIENKRFLDNKVEQQEVEEHIEVANIEKRFKSILKPTVFKSRLPIAIRYSGKSRKEILDEIGITSSMLSNYLYASPVPGFKTFNRMIDCFGVSFRWLAGDEKADIENNDFQFRGIPISIIKQRQEKLAQMIVVHFRLYRNAIEPISEILKTMGSMSLAELNHLSALAKGIRHSHNLDPRQKIVYNAYNEDFLSFSEETAYHDLLELNRITNDFNPKQLMITDEPPLDDNEIKTLTKILENLRNDPVVKSEFQSFVDTIYSRIDHLAEIDTNQDEVF